MMTNSKIKVGLVGFGYWGPNLARNFRASDLYDVRWIADISEKRLAVAKREYPEARATANYREVIGDAEVELIAIATPTHSHYEICKESIGRKKHVLVEKPLADSVERAEELIYSARSQNRILAVDHSFLFSAPVRKLKDIIDSGEIGDVFFINSERLNLGIIQSDVNVFWDLAVHDISIIDYILGGKLPVSLIAQAEHYTQGLQHEFGTVSIRYPGKKVANITVSWLSPIKTRRMMVVGSKKMVYFDDVHPDEKLKIIDKGVEYDTEKDKSLSPVYRWGDVVVPRIDNAEALSREVAELYRAIREGGAFPSLGEDGVRILKVLGAIDQSLLERKEIRLC